VYGAFDAAVANLLWPLVVFVFRLFLCLYIFQLLFLWLLMSVQLIACKGYLWINLFYAVAHIKPVDL